VLIRGSVTPVCVPAAPQCLHEPLGTHDLQILACTSVHSTRALFFRVLLKRKIQQMSFSTARSPTPTALDTEGTRVCASFIAIR
jgi:hypothetical protein